MASTLIIESFAPQNIRERSQLLEAANSGDTVLKVVSAAGYGTGDILYVGSLGMERCERAVVASVESSVQLTVAGPLQHSHIAYANITSVLGDTIRIYRALSSNGSVPPDSDFVPLSTRSIDSDSQSTYPCISPNAADRGMIRTQTLFTAAPGKPGALRNGRGALCIT